MTFLTLRSSNLFNSRTRNECVLREILLVWAFGLKFSGFELNIFCFSPILSWAWSWRLVILLIGWASLFGRWFERERGGGDQGKLTLWTKDRKNGEILGIAARWWRGRGRDRLNSFTSSVKMSWTCSSFDSAKSFIWSLISRLIQAIFLFEWFLLYVVESLKI